MKSKTPSNIECYRVTYRPEDWYRRVAQYGQFCVIIGAIDAIRWLCDRVEQLERAMKKAKVKIPKENQRG